MTDNHDLLQALLAETRPSLQEMMQERYGPLTHPIQEPAPYLENRPPFTPALMAEAGIPASLHRTLLSLRQCPTGPPTCCGTPASYSPGQPPSTTGTRRAASPATDRSTRRRQAAIARSRIGAPGSLPISAEAYIESKIILAIIGERRQTKLWAGWWHEARAIIDRVVPSRRQHLERYAAMRSLVRKKRRTWKLAEHITVLDPVLDEFD